MHQVGFYYTDISIRTVNKTLKKPVASNLKNCLEEPNGDSDICPVISDKCRDGYNKTLTQGATEIKGSDFSNTPVMTYCTVTSRN